ncbi:MAG: NAD(P)/FAD-dependent oxidoreductase [Planctomycetia bacterium]|nr:NAD(P)/FAD-dependent oxidoreductase [Planctomycetia bacterium]
MYDTLIIGAGMSGLAAGIRLAYYDQKVCVLERHYAIGGLNSYYRLDGRNYDVGLHAVTNYVPPGSRRGPLPRLLRQLRMKWEDFDLSPQIGSEVAFPYVRLMFNNDFDLLRSEVARAFPHERDNFEKMLSRVLSYEQLGDARYKDSARGMLCETIHDPLLREMILCPLFWYGNPREHDMDLGHFSILFHSIYLEGMARPWAGVRHILKHLVRKMRALGGELKLRAGVKQIRVEKDQAAAVVLDDGSELHAKQIISSAGWAETMRLCDNAPKIETQRVGRLSFTEAISALDCQPKKFDHNRTIVFFNDSDKFHWQRPDSLCDVRTGVVCSPNNFDYAAADGDLPEGLVRVTALANHERWTGLNDAEYAEAKQSSCDSMATSAVRFVPDFRPHVIATDMFTPRTISRFTGHDNGAVYGAPDKRLDGATHLKNLFLCGTDQGFLGIIGAISGGIAIANRCMSGGE